MGDEFYELPLRNLDLLCQAAIILEDLGHWGSCIMVL